MVGRPLEHNRTRQIVRALGEAKASAMAKCGWRHTRRNETSNIKICDRHEIWGGNTNDTHQPSNAIAGHGGRKR